MQYVKLHFKHLNLDETVKQHKEVYDTQTAEHIVASTKTYNNLIEDYQAQNKSPVKVERKDIFLDRAKTEKAVDAMVDEQITDTTLATLVKAFVKEKLDGACVYYKPIIRKK